LWEWPNINCSRLSITLTEKQHAFLVCFAWWHRYSISTYLLQIIVACVITGRPFSSLGTSLPIFISATSTQSVSYTNKMPVIETEPEWLLKPCKYKMFVIGWHHLIRNCGYRIQIFMLLKKYQSNIYKSYGGGGGAHFITFNKWP